MAANGTELSSKRVSKLSRRYHLHKKQLRQSAMMTEGLSDENQDYQRCMDTGCDTVRPGGIFDTSEFALSTQPPSTSSIRRSTQPPSTSSIRRSTISVAENHPAAAARRSKKHPPPRRESPGRNAKTKASENITLLSGHKLKPTGTRLPSRPPPLRDFTPPPIAPPVSDALDNSFAAGATYNDSGNTGGEGGLVDLSSAVETVAAAVEGGEVLSVNSSDDEESKESVPLFGVELVNGSPTFSLDNDQMADSPMDNEVSKYSIYSRLTHYMEGHMISESNRAAVELCLLSEAGAFVRNMDPMKMLDTGKRISVRK